MLVSNNRKISASKVVKNENEAGKEIKKLAREKIAEQLGLDKNFKKGSGNQKISPEEKRYQSVIARDVEQAKLAIGNIKKLENQSQEVQTQEAQMKAREDIDKETKKANREIERQMKTQGKELSRRERMVMEAMERSAGKVSVMAATKISGKMTEMVRQGNSAETGVIFLFSLVLAITKDVLDWLINLLNFTGVGAILVIVLCFILSLTIGLTITLFIMSVSPRGMIGKRIMKKISKRVIATMIVDSITVINIIPAMTIYVLWTWFDMMRDTKKVETDKEKFDQDLKKGRINKEMMKKYA